MYLTEKEKEELIRKALEEGDYFDEEEIIPDCTVQVLRNSKTGEVSYGWWRNVKEILM